MTKMWGAPHAGPAVRAPRDGTPSGAASTTEGGRCGDLQDWQQVTQTRLGPRSSGVRQGVDLGPSHQHLPRAGCPTGKPVQTGSPSILLHLTKCQAAPGFTSQGPPSCVRVSVSHVHRHTPSHTAFTQRSRGLAGSPPPADRAPLFSGRAFLAGHSRPRWWLSGTHWAP